MLNEKRHGWGRGLKKNVFYYEGYWKENLPFGFGRIVESSGSIYEG